MRKVTGTLRRAGWCGLWCGGVALVLASGCRTLPSHDARDEDYTLDPPDLAEPLSAAQQAHSIGLAWFSVGQMHELNREFPSALEAYRQAFRADPDHGETSLRIALNLVRLNHHLEAVETLQQLIARQPASVRPRIWLGTIYRQLQELDTARAMFEEARVLAPADADVYLQLADVYVAQSKVDAAVQVLEEGVAVVHDPVLLLRTQADLLLRKATLTSAVFERQRFQQRAIDALEVVRAREPRDIAILQSLGELYVRVRQVPAAIAVYEAALEVDPRNLQVLERLAYAYELEGRYADAARVIERLAGLQPTNASLFIALGGLYERINDLERAILNYRLATRATRSDAALYLKLGVLQLERDTVQAIADVREGLERFPDSFHLWELLAYVLYNQEKYEAAAEAFLTAMLSQPSVDEPIGVTSNFHLYHALALYFSDQLEDVAAPLRRAYALDASVLETFTHIVLHDEDDLRMARSVTIYQELLREEPDGVEARLWLAYLHSFNKEFAEALTAFQQVYEAVQDSDAAKETLNARFYFWYAASLEREKHYEEAETFFYRCLALEADHAETLNYLAYMWAERDQHLEKAEQYVLRALEQRPDSAAFIDTLGWIYYKTGRYEQARQEIRRALDLLPEDGTILDHLGDVYWKLGEKEKAIAYWKKALEQDPEDEEDKEEDDEE